MKHLIEINELKTKINTLSQGYGQHPPVQQTPNYTNALWAPPPGFIRPAAPITTHQTITPVLPQQNINRLMHEKNNEQQYAYYTRQQVQNPASLAKGNHHVNQLGHPTQIARNSTNDKVLQPYKNNQQNKSVDHNRLSNEINQKVPREKANKNSKLRAPTSEVHSETRQTPSARIDKNTTQSKHETVKITGAFFRTRPSLHKQRDEKEIVIGTLNVQNAISNQLYVNQVLKRCDILCIQEHWLYTFEKDKLNDFSSFHNVEAKSVDDRADTEIFIKNRGYGGVAVFWRNDLDHAIKFMPDGNERTTVLLFNIKERPLCIINNYMPSENKNSDEQYKENLCQLEEIIDKYQKDYDILICGDMNASLVRNNGARDSTFRKFKDENQLLLVENFPNKNTFYHHNGLYKSQIDYFLHKSNFGMLDYKVEILDMEPLNVSDHTIVYATIQAEVVRTKRKTTKVIKRPNWKRCDKNSYQASILKNLDEINIQNLSSSAEEIEKLTNILHMAGKDSIPNYRKQVTSKAIGNGIWNEEISQASKHSKNVFYEWKLDGQNHEKKQEMIKAKRLLRSAQRKG
ncbi:Hypothetical predicted protein [Mytilus galloprovincialis]|uniref:Endonuclease/exonuclease/phosphatase domain-containing protein n=2 Tax=Mytilus galloprovincialis TaxID=29158 RepID=A0A8B6G6L3_MYTGA|nr:Hypothetical predicted protein [Mytilus galloprovincialis]